MNFELVEHQADIRILVKAENFELLCREALSALSKIIYHKDFKNQIDFIEAIEIKSVDSTALIIDFLSEVLSLMHCNKTVFSEIDFELVTDNKIKGQLKGFSIESFDEDVKGVTYHEADVVKVDGKLQTFIILDI